MPISRRIDAKGKVFTNIVRKVDLRVLVQTARQVIVGNLYLNQDNRLLDEMNNGAEFLALTDVWVYDQNASQLRFTAQFLSLNKAHIITIVPVEELTMEEGEDSYLPSIEAALEVPEQEERDE